MYTVASQSDGRWAACDPAAQRQHPVTSRNLPPSVLGPPAGPDNLMATARRATNRDFKLKLKLPAAVGDGGEAGGEGGSKRQRRQSQREAAQGQEEQGEGVGPGEEEEAAEEEEEEQVRPCRAGWQSREG